MRWKRPGQHWPGCTSGSGNSSGLAFLVGKLKSLPGNTSKRSAPRRNKSASKATSTPPVSPWTMKFVTAFHGGSWCWRMATWWRLTLSSLSMASLRTPAGHTGLERLNRKSKSSWMWPRSHSSWGLINVSLATGLVILVQSFSTTRKTKMATVMSVNSSATGSNRLCTKTQWYLTTGNTARVCA